MSILLTPEQEARAEIGRFLRDAGWQVQTRKTMNLTASWGVAVCEFPTTTGPVDYLLFGDGRPIGLASTPTWAACLWCDQLGRHYNEAIGCH